MKEQDRPRLYGRLVDYEYYSGHADAGNALIDKADKESITPAVSNADATAFVAAIQGERARIEAEKAEKKQLAEAKEKEKDRQAKLAPLEQLKEAKLSELLHAEVLYNQFNGNEVAAAEKYKGKTIMVVGPVDSVKKGGAFSSDKIVLARNTGLPAIYCSVSGGSADELAKLRPGDFVRVQGKCDGKALYLGWVEMSGCIFVKVPTN